MKFLITRGPDCKLRQKLLNLFERAKVEARSFCDPKNSWIPIDEVAEGPAGWGIINNPECAKITIPILEDDLGVIFHEVFHSVFHKSPLWHVHYNSQWGDGFCDAFRFFMERMCFPSETAFIKKMQSVMKESCDQIKDKGDSYKQYLGNASRILLKCNSNYQQFQLLWKKRNHDAKTSLDQYFGF